MTRDEVIAMARKADFDGWLMRVMVMDPEVLERFAALVAAAEREAIAAEFDRRAEPGTGFYEPDEPAAIIRALGTP